LTSSWGGRGGWGWRVGNSWTLFQQGKQRSRVDLIRWSHLNITRKIVNNQSTGVIKLDCTGELGIYNLVVVKFKILSTAWSLDSIRWRESPSI
jgi:hypothetical protein